MTIEGFESPFEQELDSNNRWVKLSKQIPYHCINQSHAPTGKKLESFILRQHRKRIKQKKKYAKLLKNS